MLNSAQANPPRRRHQQNHETHLPCHFPSCGKTFHRQDLLDRHLATKQYVSSRSSYLFEHNLTLSCSIEHPSGTSRRGSDASRNSAYFAARSVSSSTNAIPPPIVAPAPSFVSEPPVTVHESGSHLPQTSEDIQRYQQVFYDQSSPALSYSSFPSVDAIL